LSGFEFTFSLFGLLLGLALADGLGGLARAVKSSHAVQIGWPTALLGLFVSCDVVTFWMYGWAMRDALPLSWPTLFGGFLVTALYYLSASLVFPDTGDGDGNHFEAHFQRHYRKVLIGILLCNIVLLATVIALTGIGDVLGFRTIVITWSFFPVSVLAILTKNRRIVLGCLMWLIALYPLSVVW
jgi:hypothetical protein